MTYHVYNTIVRQTTNYKASRTKVRGRKENDMHHEASRTTLRVTKALADLQRVRILMLLQGGELCVCQIMEVLGLAPSTVSKHLSLLNAAGLVDARKAGRWAYYRLPHGAAQAAIRPLLQWLRTSLRHDDGTKDDVLRLRRVVACAPENLARRQRKRRGKPQP